VAWLCEYNHLVNPPAASALANGKFTCCRTAANYSSSVWNVLAGWLFNDLHCGGVVSGTLEGGWMGDNLEFVEEVLGRFVVFCLC